MIAVFAMVCSVEVPDACREVMLPAPAGIAEACGQAARSFAAEWAGANPEALVVDGVDCRAAEGAPLEQVAPGVYVHFGEIALAGPDNLDDIANIAFVVGESGVAAIDSGGSRAVGEAALAALRQVTDKPLRYVFLGHMHPDHIYGATVLAEAGAQIVGHEALPAAISSRAASYRDSLIDQIGWDGFIGTAAPVIDATIAEATEYDLGGRVLRVLPQPTAHTDNDLVVVDTATDTMFVSDLVFVEHVPTLDGSILGWMGVLDDLAGMEALRIVPGHGPVVDFPEGLAPTAGYLDILARDVRAELDAGASLSQAAPRIGREAAGAWSLFDAFNERNATAAYVELEWE